MIVGALFWAMTIAACGFSAIFGGKDGRWAATLIIGASLMTIPATRLGEQWEAPEILILLVDAVLLIGLYALTLHAKSYFPIWMSGFHLVAVLTHLSTVIAPDFTPAIYRALGSVWAIPISLAMVFGILMDRHPQPLVCLRRWKIKLASRAPRADAD